MKAILTALVLACPLLTQAEKVKVADLKHPVKACLWKVEGKGLKEPSWLFGTIHLGDPRVTTLHPNAEAAFEAADAVYTEIDMSPAAQLAVAPLMMRSDGKKLTEAIGPKLTKQLNTVLQGINPALNTAVLEPLKTWAVAATLPILELQLQGDQALDAVLYQRAKKDRKSVGALETAKQQMGIFDQFNEQDQQSFLADTLNMMQEDTKKNKTTVDKLLRIYLTGDSTKIARFMKKEMARMDTDPELTKRLMTALLDDRNVGMADKADQFMQADPDQSHFFAVGAAHYTGQAAIQDLLTKKGYTITPAFN